MEAFSVQYYILFNAVLVVASCFLTWIEPKIFVVEMRGIDMLDGKIVFSLGLIGVVSICYELFRKQIRYYWIYGMVGFLIMVTSGFIFYNYYQNNASGGPGIYLAALGGIQLTGTYVIYLQQLGKR